MHDYLCLPLVTLASWEAQTIYDIGNPRLEFRHGATLLQCRDQQRACGRGRAGLIPETQAKPLCEVIVGTQTRRDAALERWSLVIGHQTSTRTQLRFSGVRAIVEWDWRCGILDMLVSSFLQSLRPLQGKLDLRFRHSMLVISGPSLSSFIPCFLAVAFRRGGWLKACLIFLLEIPAFVQACGVGVSSI